MNNIKWRNRIERMTGWCRSDRMRFNGNCGPQLAHDVPENRQQRRRKERSKELDELGDMLEMKIGQRWYGHFRCPEILFCRYVSLAFPVAVTARPQCNSRAVSGRVLMLMLIGMTCGPLYSLKSEQRAPLSPLISALAETQPRYDHPPILLTIDNSIPFNTIRFQSNNWSVLSTLSWEGGRRRRVAISAARCHYATCLLETYSHFFLGCNWCLRSELRCLAALNEGSGVGNISHANE